MLPEPTAPIRRRTASTSRAARRRRSRLAAPGPATSRTLLLALVVSAAIVPTTATAAELTYVDQDDVWVENLDGSARHALTDDGTSDRPYSLPTANDAGDLAAFQPSAAGDPEIVYWAGGGGTPVRHHMPRLYEDHTGSPPTSARMQPDGVSPTLGYTYLAFGDPALPRYGRVDPHWPVENGAQASVDYVDLTWHRERPVVPRLDGAIYWTGLTQPLLNPNEPGTKLTFAEISADGTRLLVRSRDAAGGQRLALFDYQGQIGFGEITAGCAIPVGAGFTRGALSRDGRSVAWDDGAGVHLANAEPDRFDGGSTCLLDGLRTVSSTARMPSFSAASTSVPPGSSPAPSGGSLPPGGNVPPPAAPQPPSAPSPKGAAFRFTAPKSVAASGLRRGLRLRVTVPTAGRVTLTLRKGRRTIASGRATAKRAGRVQVGLRATRKAGRLTGAARLTVKFTPRSGRGSSQVFRVKVR